jgi:hypothetical protein
MGRVAALGGAEGIAGPVLRANGRVCNAEEEHGCRRQCDCELVEKSNS